MKAAFTTLLSLAIAVVVLVGARAEEDKKPEGKKETLKGMLVCGKCKLKETDSCTNALVVKKDGKDVIYWLDDKGGKKEKYHVCAGAKQAEVTGFVTTKDKKMYIKPVEDGVKIAKKKTD
jgi:hypothetical protein